MRDQCDPSHVPDEVRLPAGKNPLVDFPHSVVKFTLLLALEQSK